MGLGAADGFVIDDEEFDRDKGVFATALGADAEDELAGSARFRSATNENVEDAECAGT